MSDAPDKADRITAESNRWALENTSHARGDRDLIEGRTFTTGDMWEDVAEKAKADNDRNFMLQNPAGSGKHIIVSIEVTASGGEMFSTLHTNPGVNALGTVKTPLNNKVGGASATVIDAYSNSDLDFTQGDQFPKRIVGAGASGFARSSPGISPFDLIQVPPDNTIAQNLINLTKKTDIAIEMSYAEIDVEDV